MQDYMHRVLGFYASRAEAQAVFDRLVDSGLAPRQVTIIEPGQLGQNPDGHADSDDVLKEVLRVGAIGGAVGTLAGAAGTVALALANISLFIASPVLGTLTMLGWGASLGGLVGAAVGAEGSKGDVADLVKDALASGHVVLVAHAASEAQTTRSRQIIGQSMHAPGQASPGAAAPAAPAQN